MLIHLLHRSLKGKDTVSSFDELFNKLLTCFGHVQVFIAAIPIRG